MSTEDHTTHAPDAPRPKTASSGGLLFLAPLDIRGAGTGLPPDPLLDRALLEARLGADFPIVDPGDFELSSLVELLQRHRPRVLVLSGHGTRDTLEARLFGRCTMVHGDRVAARILRAGHRPELILLLACEAGAGFGRLLEETGAIVHGFDREINELELLRSLSRLLDELGYPADARRSPLDLYLKATGQRMPGLEGAALRRTLTSGLLLRMLEDPGESRGPRDVDAALNELAGDPDGIAAWLRS